MTEKKPRGRPFPKGRSGNPAGKPRGIRSRVTLAAEALLEGEAEALTRRAIEKALEGDTTALRLCLDRCFPVRRGSLVSFDLPKVAIAGDVPKAIAAIIGLVGTSSITPDEAVLLANLLDNQRRSIETAELADRVARLEEQLKQD